MTRKKKEPKEVIPTERVTMLWPEELKNQVRAVVGARGLTEYAVNAVRASLSHSDVLQEAQREKRALEKQLGETQELAQRLADACAMGGDNEDRFQTIQEAQLPDWIDTAGWPRDLAGLVHPVDTVPFDEPEPEEQVDPRRAQAPDHARSDLFSKVMAQSREMGISLKPASELDKPEVAGFVAAGGSESGPDWVEDAPAAEVAKKFEALEPESTVGPPESKPCPVTGCPNTAEACPGHLNAEEDTCPKCGGILVGGECWECF